MLPCASVDSCVASRVLFELAERKAIDYLRNHAKILTKMHMPLSCVALVLPWCAGMNLMSIRKFLAKSPSDDLTLHYRWKV